MYLAACESRAEESAAPPSNHLVRRHPRCHGWSAYKSGSHLALRGKTLGDAPYAVDSSRAHWTVRD
jgi:hypothetical protein